VHQGPARVIQCAKENRLRVDGNAAALGRSRESLTLWKVPRGGEMPAKHEPIFLQTKAGTKLLSGTLSFFQLGVDGKPYYLEIGQQVFVNPLPVGQVFPSDRIGTMTAARSARPVPFGWAPTPITTMNLAFPPSKDSGTQTYLNRKTIGATPGGPIRQETGMKYYQVRRISLDAYQKEVWEERLEQIEQSKSDERMRKLLKDLEDLLEAADTALKVASLLVPQARLGVISLDILRILVKASQHSISFAKATSGDEAAFHKLESAVIDMVFDKVKVVMPTWAKVICKVGIKQFDLYRTRDTKVPPSSDPRVPADDELDQIYRFRCTVQPELVKEFEMIKKNIADARAKGLTPSHRPQ
jgi:hypothetical protein